MPKVQVSKFKKDAKKLLKEEDASQVQGCLPTNGAGSSGTGDLYSNCMSKAKNFMKSISNSADKARFLVNTSFSDIEKYSAASSSSSMQFAPGECYKEYESFEDMITEVDRNITQNFDIRCKYDAGRPIKVNPPKQNYYYVEGFGLVTDKFLPDLELQKTRGLHQDKQSNQLQPIFESKSRNNFQANAYLNGNLTAWDCVKK